MRQHCSAIRQWQALWRDRRLSSDTVCDDGAETTLGATISTDQTPSGVDEPLGDDWEHVDFRLDTAAARVAGRDRPAEPDEQPS